MLRDRLVCGVNHDRIQRNLLSESKLTYAKAYELAVAIETAERDTKDLKNRQSSSGDSVHYNAHFVPTTSSRRPSTQGTHSPAQSKHRPSRSLDHSTVTCYRCGCNHLATQCRYKDTICRYCKKIGHLESVCRSKLQTARPIKGSSTPHSSSSNSKSQRNFYLEENTVSPEHSVERAYGMFSVTDGKYDPIRVNVHINGMPVEMDMDTGASATIISNSTYLQLKQEYRIQELERGDIRLKTYTGEAIQVLGKVKVQVSYNNCNLNLGVYVVEGQGPNLMGRDWLSQLKVSLLPVYSLTKNPSLDEVLKKYSDIFKEDLGCLKGDKIKLFIDSTVKPKFFKPLTVPFVLRGKVETALQKLQDQGIISEVQFSTWAAPIVPVVKRDGSVRICGIMR